MPILARRTSRHATIARDDDEDVGDRVDRLGHEQPGMAGLAVKGVPSASFRGNLQAVARMTISPILRRDRVLRPRAASFAAKDGKP